MNIYIPIAGYGRKIVYDGLRGTIAVVIYDYRIEWIDSWSLRSTTALVDMGLMLTVRYQTACGDCCPELIVVKRECSYPICCLIRIVGRSESEIDKLIGMGRCVEIIDISTGNWCLLGVW